MTEQEFDIQRALGLAEEYDLTIRTRAKQPQLGMQKIKDAVRKHTFTFKCTEENFCGSLSKSYGVELKFEVKCVHEVVDLIAAELHPHYVEIQLTLRRVRSIFEGKYYYL